MGLTFCLANSMDEAATTKNVADIEDTLLELIRNKYKDVFLPYIELLLDFDPYGNKVLSRHEVVQVHEMSKLLIDKLKENATSEYFKKEFLKFPYLEFDDLMEFVNELYKITEMAIYGRKTIFVIGD